jgi:Tfp pilus assembly protein PilV
MRQEKTLKDDDAVSIATGYILNIAIATLVLSSLLLGMRGTFDNIESTTASTQSENVAQKVAAEVTQADRIARSSDNARGNLTFTTRGSIADGNYDVEVTDGWVNVSASATDSRTTVRYNVSSDVDGTTFGGGGETVIRYNGTPNPPEVNIVG